MAGRRANQGRSHARGSRSVWAAVVVTAVLWGCRPGTPGRTEIVVFAAASLQDALLETGESFRHETGAEVVFNFAGSNVLAQQIAVSHTADVFVSADIEWLDWLRERGAIVPGTRRDLLSNRLVVVAHRDGPTALSRLAELESLPFRHLSIADPEAVPAGRYVRSCFSGIIVDGRSLWELVRDRVAPAPDVRAALALVVADPDVVGVVYRSDLEAAPSVRVLLEIERHLQPPIRYGAALLERSRGSSAAARAFLDFLQLPKASAIFEKHGFLPLS